MIGDVLVAELRLEPPRIEHRFLIPEQAAHDELVPGAGIWIPSSVPANARNAVHASEADRCSACNVTADASDANVSSARMTGRYLGDVEVTAST